MTHTLLDNARIQAKLEVEQEQAEIEAEKILISETKKDLNECYQKEKRKSDEIGNTLTENNELIQHNKREMKIEKQKAKNHGNALSRKNSLINKLKTNAEYLSSFIEESYET